MQLETARLLLRSLQPDDVEHVVSLWSDPDVTRFLGGPRDAGQVRAILQEELVEPPPGPFGQWPVVEKATGEFVGDCGLIPKEIDGAAEVDLVYVLAPGAWGKGFATEIGSALLRFAVEELGRRRLVCVIDPGNAASQHVAAKLGFHRQALILRPDGVNRELWVIEVSEGVTQRSS